jgi:hypothetical protein
MSHRYQLVALAVVVFLAVEIMNVKGSAEKEGDKKKETEYVYKEDLGRIVAMLKGGKVVYGQLDAAGNFLDVEQLKPEWVMNEPREPDEPVYEYRSGTLIKGILRKDGKFVPDEGSEIVDFKKYEKKKGVPRIYNLPGVLEEKKKE